MLLLMRIWKSRKFGEHEMVMECMHGLLWHCPWSRLHFYDHTFLYFLKTQNFLAWRLYDWRVGNVICPSSLSFKHKGPFPDILLVCGQRTPTIGYCLSVTLINVSARPEWGVVLASRNYHLHLLVWIVMYDRWVVPIVRIYLKTKSKLAASSGVMEELAYHIKGFLPYPYIYHGEASL